MLHRKTVSRSFSYSEQCVELTSDFSTIFGNEYDTIAPVILSASPRAQQNPVVKLGGSEQGGAAMEGYPEIPLKLPYSISYFFCCPII